MGIHNEPGYAQVSPVPKLKELINDLLTLVLSTSDTERSFLPFGSGNGPDEVVLMVNNLGGVSNLELSVITREAVSQLETKGIKIRRVLVGPFMVNFFFFFRIPIMNITCSIPSCPDFPQYARILVDATFTPPTW